jgi:hypothetical protein
MNCPNCKTPCLSANNGTRWFCRNCYEEVDSPQKRAERPSVSRAPKLGACREYGNEAEVVEAIRKELTARGWVVLRAGQFVVKGSGSDAYPTCFVRTPRTLRIPAKRFG